MSLSRSARLCALTSLLLATTAYGQDSTLFSDEMIMLERLIVSGPNRTETPVSESTVSVTVVDQEQIARQSSVNTPIGAILAKTTPGFGQSAENMTDYGQSLRGRNFLTLIDGVPQTNTLNNNFRGLNTISSLAVGQIEVVRGATAAYGFGAPGGLVNIITKTPQEDGFVVEYGSGIKFSPTDIGDSMSYSGVVNLSGRDGDVDFLLNGSFEKTGSSFTADGERRPPDSFGSQGGLDDVTAYNILGKLGYQMGSSRFELMINRYDNAQKSVWAGPVSGGSVEDSTSAIPSLGNLNTRTPGVDNLTISGKYSNEEVLGGSMDLQVFYNQNTTTFTRTEFLGFQYPQYETASDKYGARLTFDTPLPMLGPDMNVAWGVDYLHDKTVVNDIDGPSGTPGATLNGIAPFAQLEIDLNDTTKVTGGVRYEAMELEIPTFVNANGFTVAGGTVDVAEPLFNVSASHDLNEFATLFAGFSQGYQLGNLVRYATDNNVANIASLAANGQKTNSYEAGLRFHGDNWNVTTTGFYSTSDNGVSYSSSLDLILAPEAVYGIEVAGEYAFDNGLTLGGTVTLMEGRYDTDGDGEYDADLPSDRIAPAKITAYAEYEANDWSTYRLMGLFSGYRDPDSSEFLGLQTIEPYFVLDAAADFKVGNGTLTLGVENLLNADYVPVVQQAYSVPAYGYDDYYYVKGPGRTFSISYKGKF
ncbi:Iron-regulated outer membrane protein [Devosia sp. LC5]|uniref:TonB-dependent receptor n=1 Tax=Devosia sp. LC5 TaxID=1502724 RepID=UPI0004E352CE|nr:TonB-dependent receptor [Devosia sp. LC5]KFC61790.1 Iron-regulated outer membrane protein [Devosia sp. LC5]